MVGIDNRLLPTGHHWDLHVEHALSGSHDAGAFTPSSAGWKFCVHITVSPWGAIDSMVKVLKDKKAEPHLVLGGRSGVKHPVLAQLLPFDVAGRALQNDSSDGHQTNRAKVIQIEVCANPGYSARRALELDVGGDYLMPTECDLFALDGYYLTQLAVANVASAAHAVDDAPPTIDLCMSEPVHAAHREMAAVFESGVGSWGDETYKALGNVFELVRHRVPIPNKVARINGKSAFTTDRRFTDREWEQVSGLVGHMDAPDNDHIDPTAQFRGLQVVRFAESAPNNL